MGIGINGFGRIGRAVLRRAIHTELVIDASGRFRTRDALASHLKGGARKVLLSAPGKELDATIVPGVNDAAYDPIRHDIVSLASCTTNCVAPMVKVLHERFGLVRGFMTTIHAYTGDQVLLDAPHKDPRRARSAALNIVPTTTGAARMVGQVPPELKGRLDGIAIRVPVEDGSITDLSAQLSRSVTAQEINDAFAEAAEDKFHGILRYSTDPLVSRDIIGDAASCVFDSALTRRTTIWPRCSAGTTTNGAMPIGWSRWRSGWPEKDAAHPSIAVVHRNDHTDMNLVASRAGYRAPAADLWFVEGLPGASRQQ